MIDFRSDNTGRAAPEIFEALIRANHGTVLGSGLGRTLRVLLGNRRRFGVWSIASPRYSERAH